MDDLYSRKPVNRVASRVVKTGEHFEPAKKIQTGDSDMPIPVQPIPKAVKHQTGYVDVTGNRFGRFTVIGFARDSMGLWVVRCDCGRYSTRRVRSILNPANVQDRCEHCRHLAFLKREERYRQTGRDQDIRDF